MAPHMDWTLACQSEAAATQVRIALLNIRATRGQWIGDKTEKGKTAMSLIDVLAAATKPKT